MCKMTSVWGNSAFRHSVKTSGELRFKYRLLPNELFICSFPRSFSLFLSRIRVISILLKFMFSWWICKFDARSANTSAQDKWETKHMLSRRTRRMRRHKIKTTQWSECYLTSCMSISFDKVKRNNKYSDISRVMTTFHIYTYECMRY